ncbi:HD domain-containing phosphohydrolase, partial [Enterobacter ludwigii]|uniref:HD domain-containing phosphohydrolase n=1 Tax=Enterobacter ludwigii TaxID=299767 RepID=UPI0035E2EE01
WKPPAHSPEENMVRQKCSGIRRSYLGAASLDIPSRILAVADVFTAMTENRPYRRGMDSDKAMSILREEAANYRLDWDIVTLLGHNINSVKPLVAKC